MKTFIPALAGLFMLTHLSTGCQALKPHPPEPGNLSTRNNGYSLLHDLLAQQKDVSLLRFIKSEPPDTKELVKRIASASRAGATLLEKFAQDEPSIRLDDLRLPPAEQATRDAIAATKQKELLGQSGDTFNLTLLLTQTEALSYAAHLATVTSQNEPQSDRARALAGISADMKNLEAEVFQLLLAKSKAATTNAIGKKSE
jgi:hypothetical protein